MNSGIYIIKNLKNKRFYIGSTNDFETRKYDHFWKLKNNKHGNIFLQRDFNKTGQEIVFEILEYVDVENLLIVEQKYLDMFFDNQKTCYNISQKAHKPSGFAGKKHSKETLEMLKRPRPKEFGEKISNSKKGKKRKPFSEEWKRKLANAPKKKIISINLIDSKIEKFDSITEAAKYYNIKISQIFDVLRKKTTTAKNKTLRFEYDN